MSTEVWYRKWRPQRFGDVAGQDHITRTLANAVSSGRIAHAYLFCGPRGTGKTSTARILAKAANCRQNENGEPCNRCPSCRDVADGRALDLIEMDAASNRGIDEIRSLRDKIGYSPTASAYKVYLIDEVHELTAHAFDALLKTLEEPPPHIIFVLATTEAERVPATVASRCQRYDFRRIRVADVVGRLAQICEEENVDLPAGAPELIARRSTGSLRDAVNLLEQVVAAFGARPDLVQVEQSLGLGGSEQAARLARLALSGDLAGAFCTIGAARDQGIEPRQLQRALLDRFRALLLVKAGAETTLELSDEALNELRVDAKDSDIERVLRLLHTINSADFRSDALSSLPLELAIAQAVLQPPKAAPETRSAPVAPARLPAPESPPRPVPTRVAPVSAAPEPRAPSQVERPPVPVATVDGDPTVDRLQGLMSAIYARLREQRSVASAAYLNSGCNIIALDEDEVTLAFKHQTIAAKFSDEGGGHLGAVEAAIESLIGRKYRLRVSVDPSVENWARPQVTARTSHLLDEAEKLGLRREQ